MQKTKSKPRKKKTKNSYTTKYTLNPIHNAQPPQTAAYRLGVRIHRSLGFLVYKNGV